jgi:hypothetical protein
MHRDVFDPYHRINHRTPNLPPPDQSRILHHDPAEGWERLQLTRLRALVEDQEAELREKDFQLAMLYHELQEERLKHSTAREALERKNALVQRNVDATQVLQELSALGFTVEELKLHQQAILQLVGELTGLMGGLRLGA